MGEVHGLGTGWRIVDVEIGRKWVKVRDCLGRGGRVPKATWEKIAENATELGPVKKRRKKRTRKHALWTKEQWEGFKASLTPAEVAQLTKRGKL